MIWSFGRGDEVIRLETRFDDASRDYVLEITWSEGRTTAERFRTLSEFRTRVLALESQLADENWTQLGNPEILPHGWRGPIPH